LSVISETLCGCPRTAATATVDEFFTVRYGHQIGRRFPRLPAAAAAAAAVLVPLRHFPVRLLVTIRPASAARHNRRRGRRLRRRLRRRRRRTGPGVATQEAVYLQVLQPPVHQVVQPADPRAHAHRRAALLVRHLRQGVPPTGSPPRPPLHPFEREAVQVRRLRQGILPVAHAGCAPHPAPGGVAAQVSRVLAQLQPALQPQDAHADAHRPQAVRVHRARRCSGATATCAATS